MVSDKVIVVLLIVAILLSLVSTIVTLSLNVDSLKGLGGTKTVIYKQTNPVDETGKVGIIIQEPTA